MRSLSFIIFFCLFFISCSYSFGQKTYDIYDFSDKYGLLITTSDTISENKPAYFRLYVGTPENIIFSEGENDMKLYAEKAPIIRISKKQYCPERIFFTEDYNFDGKPDLCILSCDIYSEECYLTFQENYFYLSSGNTFEFNNELTQAYNGYLCDLKGGFLETIPDKKLLLGSIPDGAVYHICSLYQWQNGKLICIDEYTDDGLKNPVYFEIEGKRLQRDGKWKKYSYKYLDTETHKPAFSFETENGKGRVVLHIYDGNLYYAFQEDDDHIYFAYPDCPENVEKQRFGYSEINGKKFAKLDFRSGTITYSIITQLYDNKQESVKIIINVNGKETVWLANNATIKGSLFEIGTSVKNKELGNVDLASK